MKKIILGILLILSLINCIGKRDDKNSSQALVKEVRSSLDSVDYEKAIRLLEQHNKLYPDNLETRALLTVLKIQTGIMDKDDGSKIIRGLYLKDSTNQFIAESYSAMVLEFGTPEEGLKEIEKRLAKNPNNFWDVFNRGKKLLALERYEEAIVAFNKAQEIEPNSKLPFSEKVLVKYKMGDKIGACNDWQSRECISYFDKYCK